MPESVDPRHRALLAEGSYGCVFSPPLPCRSAGKKPKQPKPSTRLIGKVFQDASSANDEIRAMRIVSGLDPKGRFSVPMLSTCTVSIPDPSCELLATTRSRTATQLIYPNAGADLATFVNSDPDFDVLDMIDGMANVMHGIHTLSAAGYCHRDMKPANIMVEDRGRRMRITDFGMMVPFGQLYEKDQGYVLAFNYEYYPPEFKIYYDRAIVNLDHIADPIRFIANDVRANYLDAPLQWLTDLGDLSDVVANVLALAGDPAPSAESVHDAPDRALRAGLEVMAHKVDVFGAGATFARVFDLSQKKHNAPAKRAALYDILQACADMNPITRIDAREARDRLLALTSPGAAADGATTGSTGSSY